MKVPVWVYVEREVMVDVTVDHLKVALREDPETRAKCLDLLNSCATVMKAIPQERIRELTAEQRGVIADFLRREAERYVPAPVLITPAAPLEAGR